MKKIVLGTIIVLAGVFLLIYNLGFLGCYFKIVFSWQSLLIAIGAVRLADENPRHRDLGLILVVIGLAFLTPKILALIAPELLDVRSMTGIIFSIFIIMFGIYSIFRSKKKKFNCFFSRQHEHHPHHHECNSDQEPFWKKDDFCKGGYNKEKFDSTRFSHISANDSGYIKRDYAFSAAKDRILGTIKAVEINAVFSGVEIDFTQVELSPEAKQIRIKVNSVFSGVTIFVPAEWNVLIQKTGVFGGFDDRRLSKSTPNPNEKVVVLELEAVFGGGEVKYHE